MLETYITRPTEGVEKYACLATFDKIIENEYNLNISRYVDTFVEEEDISLIELSDVMQKLSSNLNMRRRICLRC